MFGLNSQLEEVVTKLENKLPPGYSFVFIKGYSNPKIEIKNGYNSCSFETEVLDTKSIYSDYHTQINSTLNFIVKESWKRFLKEGY